MTYERNGVQPYTMNDLKKAFPNVGFPTNSFANESFRSEYGITEVSASALPPTNVVPTDPNPVPAGHEAISGEPEFVDGEWRETWDYIEKNYKEKRLEEYGAPQDQLEYITENGLEAWQTKVAEIKTRIPKVLTDGPYPLDRDDT